MPARLLHRIAHALRMNRTTPWAAIDGDTVWVGLKCRGCDTFTRTRPSELALVPEPPRLNDKKTTTRE